MPLLTSAIVQEAAKLVAVVARSGAHGDEAALLEESLVDVSCRPPIEKSGDSEQYSENSIVENCGCLELLESRLSTSSDLDLLHMQGTRSVPK